jgi:predicted AlkP superfamily pyrophosphatase or phosphodiesterase
VKEFNAARHADKYLKAEWKPLAAHPDYTPFSRVMAGTYAALEKSPYANELVAQFAERAIDAEKLGQRGVTDLLSVSFSANDYIGHDYGPDSPEVRDISLRTDRLIGKLLDFIEARVGRDNYVVAFTADHGVAPHPERMKERRGPAGRLTTKSILAAVRTALEKQYGAGNWVLGNKGPDPYLNRELIRTKGLDENSVHRAAADAIRALPHVARVYTREQLLKGEAATDMVGRRVLNGFYAPRAPDVVTILDPYHIESGSGTTHGSPYNYDAHVPVVFMGSGIKPGVYHARVASNDIAPTLAALLWLEPPGGSVGRVLAEALE